MGVIEAAQGQDTVFTFASFICAVLETGTATDLIRARYLWENINDGESANWQNVLANQTPNWSAIGTTQAPTWQSVQTTQTPNWNNIDDTQPANWQNVQNKM